jgi:ribonuclease P protein subunit RPR2
MASKRRRALSASMRRERASKAQVRLTRVLNQPWRHSSEKVDAAAQQLWAVSRRHQLGLPEDVRIWICRGCHGLLRPGISARVRVRGGRRFTTCLSCGRISRRGPDFSSENSDGGEGR